MFNLNVKGGSIFIPRTDFLERGTDEETIKTFNLYEKYLIRILSKGGERINVDWKEMEYIISKADYRQREAIRQYVYAVLLSLGILVEKAKGAYTFSDEGMNPVWGMPGSDFSPFPRNDVYFSREEDIISHCQARYTGRIGDWRIFEVKREITKQEICK